MAMLAILSLMVLTACNEKHTMHASTVESSEENSKTANQRAQIGTADADDAIEVTQGGCDDRDLGQLVAESVVRDTVNPRSPALRGTLQGIELSRELVMERIISPQMRRVVIQERRARFTASFAIADGQEKSEYTVFILERDPLPGKRAIVVTLIDQGRRERLDQDGNGYEFSGRKISVRNDRLAGKQSVEILYLPAVRVNFQHSFQLPRNLRIMPETISVAAQTGKSPPRISSNTFTFDANNNIVTIDNTIENRNTIFEGTRMLVDYRHIVLDRLAYSLDVDSTVLNTEQLLCSYDDTSGNKHGLACTYRDGKVHFASSDFVPERRVKVALQIRPGAERKYPLGSNHIADTVSISIGRNSCTGDELVIDNNGQLLLDSDAATTACPMLEDFTANRQTLIIDWRTFTPRQGQFSFPSSFFSAHIHNGMCYELTVDDEEYEDFTVSNQQATISNRLPYDAEVEFKVSLYNDDD